jgi:hypothetical protein
MYISDGNWQERSRDTDVVPITPTAPGSRRAAVGFSESSSTTTEAGPRTLAEPTRLPSRRHGRTRARGRSRRRTACRWPAATWNCKFCASRTRRLMAVTSPAMWTRDAATPALRSRAQSGFSLYCAAGSGRRGTGVARQGGTPIDPHHVEWLG